jgi:kinesin family protein 23
MLFHCIAPSLVIVIPFHPSHALQVCLRVRPLTFGESTDGSSCIDHTDDDPNAILFKIEELEREKKQARFVFSKIFPGDSTQHRVFEDTTLPLVTDLLLGRNALLFTYGITNSGKTHTMEGPDANPGIIKRLLAVVFNSIKEYRADPCLFRINHHNGVDVLV